MKLSVNFEKEKGIKTFKVTATFTSYGEVEIAAEDMEHAYELAEELPGEGFKEIDTADGWEIEIDPVR